MDLKTVGTRMKADPERPVGVVYLIGQLSMGGTEQQLLQLVKNLDRTRFRPSVICLSEHAELAASVQAADCPTFVLNRLRDGHLKTLLHTCQLARQLRPRILHSFAYAGRAGVIASKTSGIPSTLVSIRANPEWVSLWNWLLDRLVFSSTDIMLTNSHQALVTLKARGLGPRSAARVIHNGLDLRTFDRMMTESLNGHHDQGRERPDRETRQTICVVGRLWPVKGLEHLLDAFAIVLASRPEARLWVVGDGPLRGSLQVMARRLDVDGQVVFWGGRADVPAILRQATMGVSSSRNEGFPNSVLEYMAARLPVVATRVGGIPELVADGETGLLVPPGDPAALAEAILYVLSNPAVARRFGDAGRCRVEERFTVQRMVQETEAVYEKLLSRNDH